MLDNFMRDKLNLIKKNSIRIEEVKASVQDKIFINDTSIPVEEGDIFEYTNPAGIMSYLMATKVIYYNHSSLGHIEINYKKAEIICRVYLDTNIVSRANDFRIKEEDATALRLISEEIDKRKLDIFTSVKAKEEIGKMQVVAQRDLLLFICNLLKKVPIVNLIESIPSTYGSVAYGSSAFGGGCSAENPLFMKLKVVFDKDDAEHIFQAEKSNMDFFLTLDRKSIIDRISEKPEEFRKIGLRINIVSPVDLLSILETRK